MMETYAAPVCFAAAVYGCTQNEKHIVYIEPALSGVPGGLIACPFKDGVMELRHGITMTVTAGENTGLVLPKEKLIIVPPVSVGESA